MIAVATINIEIEGLSKQGRFTSDWSPLLAIHLYIAELHLLTKTYVVTPYWNHHSKALSFCLSQIVNLAVSANLIKLNSETNHNEVHVSCTQDLVTHAQGISSESKSADKCQIVSGYNFVFKEPSGTLVAHFCF